MKTIYKGNRINNVPAKSESLYNILISPIITEKANLLAEKEDQVVFKVCREANKLEIKAAFEMAFNVKVAKVRVLNMQGKAKRFGRFTGRRNHWKKAYINLFPNQNFELALNNQN